MRQVTALRDDEIFLKLSDFAANVIIRRAQLGLSQANLAAKAGLSRAAVSDIERVASLKTSYGTLVHIANALETSIDILFTPRNKKPVTTPELLRRAHAVDGEFVDARALHAALSERDKQKKKRFSNAGRPRAKTQAVAEKKQTLER